MVDDHAGVREAFAGLLAQQADLEVVGQCADGSQVVEAARRLRPDVVVMDLSMPRMDGLAATQALLQVQPDARVLILTARGPEVLPAALAAGARGCAAKWSRAATLLSCIRSVAVGCTCCLDTAAAG